MKSLRCLEVNNEARLCALSRHLGCEFKQQDLLQLALIHRSFHGQKNNERLEFLGDAILNFVIAEVLYERFPQAQEGQLSRLRAELVSGASLAELAKRFELGQYLYLGAGELKSGGHRRNSILADAFEAIIGALYLDQGLSICQSIVLRWFTDKLESVHLDISKDPKTTLQEKLQAYQLPLPLYEVENIVGDAHNQIFNVVCRVQKISYETRGQGTSRRQAEQQAAQHYLKWLATQDIKKWV